MSRIVILLALPALLVVEGCRTTRPTAQLDHLGAPETLRTLAQGKVIGAEGDAHTQAWLGLPFAAPPVGPLRWRAPQAPAKWDGVREATAFGPACPQPANDLAADGSGDSGYTGSEDCLTLNVWAPAFAPNAVPQGTQRLPVMLWIHGGGNSIGSARFYDPARLASEQHVVVITTQYRLGPLGWFRHQALRAESSDPLDQSGNFATLDLVRALEWVRDNAAAFGGDPGNVTVFGESAGGQNVLTLLLAPQARGLFQRAIVESGGLWATTTTEAEAFTDAQPAGLPNSSNEVLLRLLVNEGQARDRAEARQKLAALPEAEVARYLRSRTPAQLLAAYTPMRAGLHMIDLPTAFHDGAVLPAGDFLDRLGQADGWNQVPVLIGTNREEFKLFLFLDPARIHLRFWLLPRYVDEADYQVTADVLSRLWRVVGADQPAEAMRRSGAEVFEYRFDWRGEPRTLGTDLSGMMGAAHSVELPFLFNHYDMGALGMLFGDADRPEREKLGAAMRAYWGAFARSGAPGRGGGAWPEWKPWDPAAEAPKFLVLDVDPAGGIRPSPEQESIPGILADLERDPRAPTPLARCKVLHELTYWARGFTRADYAQRCPAYPFEGYPWR